MTRPTAQPEARSERRALAFAALALLVILAYLPVWRAGFIWDDDTSVTANRFVQSRDGLGLFWASTRTPDYWPVTATTFWAEWRLWGDNPVGYHATNLALHVGETLLLFVILRRLRVPGAWAGALLFGLHPLNAESVAWITQRKNLMAMLFFELSILSFLTAGAFGGAGGNRLDISPARDRGNSTHPGFYGLSLIAFVLGMLSKGSVAFLPLVLLGIVAWRRRLVLRDLLWSAPYFAVAVTFAVVDVWFQKHQLGAGEVVRHAGFLPRLLGAGAAVAFYAEKAVFPVGLLFVYPLWAIDPGDWRWWLPLAGVAIASGWLLLRARKPRPVLERGVLFAWLYFGLALGPVLGFTDVVFMKFSLVANHYAHLALLGATALAGAGWGVWRDRSTRRFAPDAVLAAVAAVFLVLTWRQCLLLRSSRDLFEAAVRANPNSAMVRNNLGVAYADERRLDDALAQFQTALRLQPDYAEAERNLALTLARSGHPADAVSHYEAALRLRPDYPEALDDLGNALLWLNRPAEAIPRFEASLKLDPSNAEAECNLGIALAREGRGAEALHHLDAAAGLDPGNASIRANRDELRAEIEGGRVTP